MRFLLFVLLILPTTAFSFPLLEWKVSNLTTSEILVWCRVNDGSIAWDKKVEGVSVTLPQVLTFSTPGKAGITSLLKAAANGIISGAAPDPSTPYLLENSGYMPVTGQKIILFTYGAYSSPLHDLLIDSPTSQTNSAPEATQLITILRSFCRI